MGWLAAALPWIKGIGTAASAYSAVDDAFSGNKGGGGVSMQNGLPTPEWMRQMQGIGLEGYEASRRGAGQLNQELGPQETGTALRDFNNMLRGTEGQYGLMDQTSAISGELADINSAVNAKTRTNDARDVRMLGPAFREEIYRLNDPLFKQMAIQQSDTYTMDRLQQQANAELDLNGQLSGQDKRLAAQTSRQGDQDRGVLRSGMSIGNEVLNTDAMMRQRQDRSRAFGADVENMQFGQGQQRINNRLATYFDPAQAVLGRPSVNQSTTGGMMGMNQNMLLNNQQPNGLSQINDWTSTLLGNALDTTAMNSNNAAGRQAGGLGALGGILGGINWDELFGGGGGTNSGTKRGNDPEDFGLDGGWM